MAGINEQDLIDEILFDIKAKDLIKGKLVLASLKEVSRETQKQALMAVSLADDDFAIPLLAGVIANDPDVTQAFPQIKETLYSKLMNSQDILLDLLPKTAEGAERALLVEMAGEIRLEKAVPHLLDILIGEKDPKTIEKVIASLGILGDGSSVDTISEFLYAGQREVVGASVRALGQLATPKAIEHLHKRLGGDSEMDGMIIDVMAKIQTTEAMEKLNETLGSDHAHIRTAGKKKLRAVGITAVRVLIRNLSGKNTDLIIHSLNVLGEIGEAAAIPAIRDLINNQPKGPTVRFAAYEALGNLPLSKGTFVLAAGLEDPDPSVRSAAARAIDHNFNPALAAGITNMIGIGDKGGLEIIHTTIDAECDKIFLGLWEEDAYRQPAEKYLGTQAHPDIRSHFVKLLAESGQGDLAEKEASAKEAKAGDKRSVFAVDDSKMILNIYRKILHNLGYEPHLFEFPSGALEQIQKDKPQVVLTDLNMPDITGIDLAKSVRQWYTKEELPIIMITTQDEGQDNETALAAGVNTVLQKPFTEEQIEAVLAEYITQ